MTRTSAPAETDPKEHTSQAEELLADFQLGDLAGHMNDELRERVHSELAPCPDVEFLARYLELHEAQFGEFSAN